MPYSVKELEWPYRNHESYRDSESRSYVRNYSDPDKALNDRRYDAERRFKEHLSNISRIDQNSSDLQRALDAAKTLSQNSINEFNTEVRKLVELSRQYSDVSLDFRDVEGKLHEIDRILRNADKELDYIIGAFKEYAP